MSVTNVSKAELAEAGSDKGTMVTTTGDNGEVSAVAAALGAATPGVAPAAAISGAVTEAAAEVHFGSGAEAANAGAATFGTDA